MKYISKIYEKFINIDESKKQRVFALFAFCFYISYSLITKDKNSGYILSAVPVAVVAGAKTAAATSAKVAAKTAAKKAGAAALEGAKVGAAKGAVEGASNTEEGESKVGGAVKGATKGAAKGAINAGKTSLMGSAKEAYNLKKGNPQVNAGVKNTNPNPESVKSSDRISADEASSDSKASNTENKDETKLKDDKKKKGFVPSEIDLSNDDINEGSSTVLKKDTGKKVMIGCALFGPFLLIMFGIPILVSTILSPTSNVINQIECSEVDTKCQNNKKLNDFIEKAQNFFIYGNFKTTAGVLADEALLVHNKIYDEYGVSIDIPLLLSTMLSDTVDLEDDEVESNKESNKIIKERMEYMEELALLQVFENSVVYTCMEKEVDGKKIYYKEIDYTGIDPSTVEKGECNASTVGKTLKEEANSISKSNYYDILKENKDLLGKIYGEDSVKKEEDLTNLINDIRLERDLFKLMYQDDSDESGPGNIPLSVIYDTNINLQTPLKGSYFITSPYGERTGMFSGFHKGADVVSGDKNIYAAGDGVVTGRYTEKLGGNVIEITHTASDGTKYISTYGHLSKFLIEKGAEVKAGDIIAIMGDTGEVSGVHLHFQFSESKTRKTYNPLNLFTEATNYSSYS